MAGAEDAAAARRGPGQFVDVGPAAARHVCLGQVQGRHTEQPVREDVLEQLVGCGLGVRLAVGAFPCLAAGGEHAQKPGRPIVRGLPPRARRQEEQAVLLRTPACCDGESLPAIVAAGGGSIVNVSSAGPFLGGPAPTTYSASKHALHSLTRHTARTWGKRDVRANAVAPGAVLTEAAARVVTDEAAEELLQDTALPRLGRPDDLASMLAFLLSDEGSWITGQILSVDGGLTMRE
ncbi:SDR family NAD(P)-dependent oxidoreductase [Streptomyces sp. NPDC090493]|uniref:SDR family NAD(P)-dependent oxidoreductase n=1 Tax=Streptomyces sp. NPDC090493 TaxID=3365964 RepID=UPI00381C241B